MADRRGPIMPTSDAGPMPRLGPRPLPLHLALAVTTWLSSRAALPILSNGLLSWKPALADRGQSLRAALEGAPPEAFAAAVEAAASRRFAALLAGITAYQRHPYRRRLEDAPVFWSQGSTRLLDYGPLEGTDNGATAVLVIPSLINRGYILDLSERRSLLRYLAGRGLRPVLVDWGAPGDVERDYDLTNYIAGRLEAALDAVLSHVGGRVLLLGYCMGGLLALALALRRPGDVAGLALMATPWDFHADDPQQARAAAGLAEPLMPFFEALGEMPIDMLQAMFAGLDPFLTVRKFSDFAGLAGDSEQAEEFVALEDWVNDGVPLTVPVARDCLFGWYRDNLAAAERWCVGGRPVSPRELAMPSLLMIPEHDRIVPPASAAALADAIPGARRRTVPTGHIGMVVGRQAKRSVWGPLARWLVGVHG